MRVPVLLHDILAETAAVMPDAIALTSGGCSYTYRDLDQRANALAHALQERGVARGDRVFVFTDNRAETVISFWGILKANAVATIVHPQTKVEKLAYMLADTGARALVTDQAHEAVYATAVRSAPQLTTVVVVGLDMAAPGRLGHVPRLTSFADVTLPLALTPPVRRCIDGDLAAIIYTSGSTGEPRGVMLTHRNMVAATTSVAAYLEPRSDDVILCVLPLAFSYGLYQLVLAASCGARVVLHRSFAYPTEIVMSIIEEKVTVLPGVPMMFATLLAFMTKLKSDVSSVRCVTNAGAALPINHLRAMREAMPGARLFSMYGMTECKRATYLPPEDIDRKPGSIGIAIPNTELWLVDADGQRLGPGQIGELVIRGPNVMSGYWGKPELSAAKLRPGPIPGERVLYTGDLCRLDDEGYLYFVGRMDDVIKSRGEKVAPAEVENAILSIPGVREAAVIGVPDETLGFAIKAFVVLEPAASLDAATIQRECRARLESFKVPSSIEIRTTLPRNDNGKIQKSELASSFTPSEKAHEHS